MKKSILFLILSLTVATVFSQSPTVTGVSPSSAIGETNIVLSGTNFTGTKSVILRSGVDVSVPFRVVNPTSILVTVNLSPSQYVNGRNGSIFIVTNSSGSNTTGPNFTYRPLANACSSIIYGDWSDCKNNKQTRSYVASPSGCVSKPPKDSIERDCISPKITGLVYYKKDDAVVFRSNVDGVLNIKLGTTVVESYSYSAGDVNIDLDHVDVGSFVAETYGHTIDINKTYQLVVSPTPWEDSITVIEALFGQSPYTYSINSTTNYVSNLSSTVTPNTKYTLRVKDASNKVASLIITTGPKVKRIQTDPITTTKYTGYIPTDSATDAQTTTVVSPDYYDQLYVGANGSPIKRTTTNRTDRTPPSTGINDPMNNSIVTGTISIRGLVTDNVAVTAVIILFDNTALTNMSYNTAQTYFNYSFNSNLYSNGVHTITATGYDAAGNFSSYSVQITISNNITPPPVLAPDITPPTVGIQQISTNCPQPIPCNITDLQLRNYFIGYDITITLLVQDNRKTKSVKWYIDDQVVNTVTYATGTEPGFYYGSYTWSTVGATPGNHTLKAWGMDSSGNTAYSVILPFTLNYQLSVVPNLPVSYKMKVPPVLDQSPEGSCAAMAATYYAGSIYMYKKLNSTAFSYFTNILSPEYVYDRTKANSINSSGVETCGGGSNILVNWEFMHDTGNVLFSTLPYNGGGYNGCDRSISTPYDGVASSRKTPLYAKCYTTDIATIKSAIYQGKAAVTAFGVDNPAINAGPGFIWSTHPDGGVGHAMTIVGWDDRIGTTGAFLIVNSWGTSWCDNGYIWCTYENFPNVAWVYTYFLNDL